MASVAGVTAEEVAQVVEVFRQPGRCFLTPPVGVPLNANAVLDVCHESLIRQWDKLDGERNGETGAVDEATGWLHKEVESASIYRRLAQAAALWKDGEAGLWRTPDLELALDWRDREPHTAAWAERYGGGFEISMEFLAASEEQHTKRLVAEEEVRKAKRTEKQKEQRRRFFVWGAVVGVMLSVTIAGAAIAIAVAKKLPQAMTEQSTVENR